MRAYFSPLFGSGRLHGIFWYVWNEPDKASIYRNGALVEAGKKAIVRYRQNNAWRAWHGMSGQRSDVAVAGVRERTDEGHTRAILVTSTLIMDPAMNTDLELQQAIYRCIAERPDVNAKEVSVQVLMGVVTVIGTLGTDREKWQIENAIRDMQASRVCTTTPCVRRGICRARQVRISGDRPFLPLKFPST